MLRTFLAMAALASPLHAAPLWLEDYDAALKTASTTGKYVLVDVTGSDWCPPCQQMEAEVFSRPGFSVAAERYVLLRLDYPRTIVQSEKLKAQNKKLAQKYPFDGVPTYFMLDGKGDAFGKYTGYLPGGVTAFLSLARNFETQKDVLDKLAVAVLNAAPGVDRARAQDALYRQAEDWDLQWRYADLPMKIIQDDKDGTAKLKPRYQILNAYNRLLASWAGSDPKQAIDTLTSLANQAQPWSDLVQKILFTKGMIQLNALGDELKARDTFRAVRTLGPQTDAGKRAAELLDQLP